LQISWLSLAANSDTRPWLTCVPAAAGILGARAWVVTRRPGPAAPPVRGLLSSGAGILSIFAISVLFWWHISEPHAKRRRSNPWCALDSVLFIPEFDRTDRSLVSGRVFDEMSGWESARAMAH
jgi:hypothetical protein